MATLILGSEPVIGYSSELLSDTVIGYRVLSVRLSDTPDTLVDTLVGPLVVTVETQVDTARHTKKTG